MPDIKYMIRERVCRYFKNIADMKDDRWPKICLSEEIRSLMNNNPSRWGTEVVKIIKELNVLKSTKKYGVE